MTRILNLLWTPCLVPVILESPAAFVLHMALQVQEGHHQEGHHHERTTAKEDLDLVVVGKLNLFYG